MVVSRIFTVCDNIMYVVNTHLYMQISHDHSFITVTMQVRFLDLPRQVTGSAVQCRKREAQREIAVAIAG